MTNSIPANAVTTFEGVTNATFSGSVNRLTGALLAKSFSPSTIANGGTTVMTINVRNYNLTALSGIGFTDTLPADLTVGSPAQPALIASDCQSPSSTVASGFTFMVLIPAATSFAISGGTLAAAPTGNASTNCNIRVNIVGSNATLNAFNRTNGASNITGWTNTDNVQTGVSGGQGDRQSEFPDHRDEVVLAVADLPGRVQRRDDRAHQRERERSDQRRIHRQRREHGRALRSRPLRRRRQPAACPLR